MVTCRIKLFLAVLFLASLLWSETGTPGLKQDMLEHYAKIETFEADFFQDNFWQEIDTELSSRGKIYFNNENLKLEYTDPEGQFLILDSLQVTMYDPASNQAIISTSSEIDIRPRSIIQKYWQDSLLVSVQQEGDSAVVKLRTEAGDQIELQTENDLIKELIYTDNDSNRVVYKFRDIRINQTLPDKIFDVKLPENVNLLDTREQE